jgi:Mn2+/Fe2+ NRAMP family transporter
MAESTRRYVVRQILEWNSIPLIFVGGLTAISFSFSGVFLLNFGTVILGLGIYSLYASARLKSMQSDQWLHPIGWAILIGIPTLIAMYLLVSGVKNLLSITFGILLAQLTVAVAVLLLSVAKKRGNDKMLNGPMSEQAATKSVHLKTNAPSVNDSPPER